MQAIIESELKMRSSSETKRQRQSADPLQRQSREDWAAEEAAQGTASWSQMEPWIPLLPKTPFGF